MSKIQNKKSLKDLHRLKDHNKYLQDKNFKLAEEIERIRKTLQEKERIIFDQNLRIAFLQNQISMFKKGKI
jgi:hypothetical protein